MTSEQVLVAGGGIGGLAAALAAARAGCEVRLYERAPAFSEVGAGVQLGPNVVRVLQGWGLHDALHAVAAVPDRLQVRSATHGGVLAELPLGARAEQRYGAPYVTIHRADLHALLLQAVQAQGGVALYLGQAVHGVHEPGGGVQLALAPGKAVEGDALIGADGLWSTVRQGLLGPERPRVSGHLAYRALLPQEALPPALRTGCVTAWLGPRLHAVQYPVRRGTHQNLVVIVQGPAPHDLEHWDHSANATDLEQALAGTCQALQQAVRGVAEAGYGWRLWPLCDRPPVAGADQMARGLVALLGDAAHPMRPYLAQGAGMAIEDAAELERALAQRAIEMPLRLRRYALNRWQRNARVQARSERNGRIFHATGLVRWGRDLSLRALGARLLDVPWLYQGPSL